MLKEVAKGEMGECIDFAWQLCGDKKTNSFPLRHTKAELRNYFESIEKYPDDRLLAVHYANKLCGVAYLLIKPQERYIQTAGIYVSDPFEQIMDELLDYAKQHYSCCELYLGYPKENEKAGEYCTRMGFELIESSIDMRLDREKLVRAREIADITRLAREDFQEYAEFHERHFADIYWNSERIKEHFEKWYIYVHRESGKIDGGIFLNEQSAKVCEIFGVADETNSKRLVYDLIVAALKDIFSMTSYQTAVYFVNESSQAEQLAAEKAGFVYHSSYRCYKAQL
jgi:hypothetical protein